MDVKIEVGEKAYIIENNHHIRECMVVKQNGEFYILRFTGSRMANSAGTSLRGSRIYTTWEEAERHLPLKKEIVPGPRHRRMRTPYEFE